MNALRAQGIGFCFAAVGATYGAAAYRQLPPATSLGLVGILIIALGVPHGALDTLIAHQRGWVPTWSRWLKFITWYLASAALVMVLWAVAPALFLAGFLVASLVHFSGDPLEGTPIATRILHGGAAIVLPTLLHPDEVERSLSILSDGPSAHACVVLLHLVSLPWTLALILAVGAALRRDGFAGLELLALGALMIFAPPLLAFTVFFCGMHGARHIVRALRYYDLKISLGQIAAVVLPTLAVFLLLTTVWQFLRGVPFESKATAVIFVALAALTFPHMAVVEPLRRVGWRASDNGSPTRRDRSAARAAGNSRNVTSEVQLRPV